jgi:hypothetical protein
VLLQSPSWEWSGELPHVALTILHQHAIQGDVTDLQLAMVRWIAYSKKALELPLDYRILFRLLQELDQQWNLLTLTKEEVSCVSVSLVLQQERHLVEISCPFPSAFVWCLKISVKVSLPAISRQLNPTSVKFLRGRIVPYITMSVYKQENCL